MSCPYAVGNSSYPQYHGADDWIIESLSPKKLKLAAQLLDIDPELPPEELCRQIQQHIPDEAWLIDNMIVASKLDESSQDFIHNYTSYGYRSINNRLRSYSGTNPRLLSINLAIDLTRPLEKDIVVMRSFRSNSGLPERGLFQSKGYLSTSFGYARYAKHPSYFNELSYARIFVPAGTRALYIPGSEDELIFKHDITLEVLAHYMKRIIIDGREYHMNWYDVQMIPG